MKRLVRSGLVQMPSFRVTLTFFYGEQTVISSFKWWSEYTFVAHLCVTVNWGSSYYADTAGILFHVSSWLVWAAAVSHPLCSAPKLLLVPFYSTSNYWLLTNRYDINIGPWTWNILTLMSFWRVPCGRGQRELWQEKYSSFSKTIESEVRQFKKTVYSDLHCVWTVNYYFAYVSHSSVIGNILWLVTMLSQHVEIPLQDFYAILLITDVSHYCH